MNFMEIKISKPVGYGFIVIMGIQMYLVILQYFLNKNDIIPSSDDNLDNYNYYKTEEFIKKNKLNLEENCSICLYDLKPKEPNPNNEDRLEVKDDNPKDIKDTKYSMTNSDNKSDEDLKEEYDLRMNNEDIRFTKTSKIKSFLIAGIYKAIIKPLNFIRKIVGKILAFVINIICCCAWRRYQNRRNTQKSNLMITPCNHIFHAECLLIWYDKKESCPICRTALPFIE